MSNPYDDNLLAEGSVYTVGINDGCQFKEVIYVGTKLFKGKSMMVFKTSGSNSRQITVNPSYHSFVIEEPISEMNEVLWKQSGWSEQQTLEGDS